MVTPHKDEDGKRTTVVIIIVTTIRFAPLIVRQGGSAGLKFITVGGIGYDAYQLLIYCFPFLFFFLISGLYAINASYP